MAIAVAAIMLLSGASPAEPTPADPLLDEVLISGEQPGPAMWKVSRDGHTMWIVGTLTPLPSKMTWRSRQVEDVISRSGEILGGYSSHAKVKGGWFTGIRMLPAVMRLRFNADGKTLREVLPPATYSRWSALHRQFFGHDPDPKERARPAYAAGLLYDRALEKSGLSERQVVWPVVTDLARRHKVRIRELELNVPVDDPKGILHELQQPASAREIACLDTILDRIEHDLPNMKRRAQAWAVGDVATIRALPNVFQQQTCFDALMERPKLKQLIDEQIAKVNADRPRIISYMIAAHENSFTVQPIEELLGEKGLLAELRAAGYTIEEPM